MTPPVEPITPLRAGAAPAARPQAAPAAAAAAPAAPRAQGDSYAVKRGDTLSKIAKEYKPETVTLDQMLVALFKSNQNAFDGANMNRLRSGAIITIPNAVDASAASPQEATKVVSVQASDWRTYRDRVAGAAPMADEASTRAAGGRIGTAVRGAHARRASGQRPAARVEGRGHRQGCGRGRRQRGARGAIARSAEPHRGSREDAEGHAARGRAQEPDDGAVADGCEQGQGARRCGAAARRGAGDAAAEGGGAREGRTAEGRRAAQGRGAAEGREPPKAVEPPKAEPPKAAEPKPEARVGTAQGPKPPKAEPPKAAAAEGRAPKAPAKEPPGFFEEFLASTPGWVIGGGALLMLGGIAALLAARRRKTTKFEDSIISGTDIKTNTVFGSTGGGVVNTGDNSLASDFSREGLGNIDTDEVDPIAEAEVYLAYGRDAQAEEILKDALKKDPQRQEIYLKLLEIHAQHNKPSAFETVATELYAVTGGQGEVWQKAVGLGRQLDPNNPMFTEGGAPAARPAAATPFASERGADRQRCRRGRNGRAGARFPDGRGDLDLADVRREAQVAGRHPGRRRIRAREDREGRPPSMDFDPDKTMSLSAGAVAGVAATGAALAGAAAAGKAGLQSMTSSFAEKVGDGEGQGASRRRSSISTSSSTTPRSRRRLASRAASPCSRPRPPPRHPRRRRAPRRRS